MQHHTSTTAVNNIRLLIRLLDEVELCEPETPRADLVRRFAGSRNFEERMIKGKVSPRRMAAAENRIVDWLGRI